MLIATEYEVIRRELEDILANRLSRTAQPYPSAHVHAADGGPLQGCWLGERELPF